MRDNFGVKKAVSKPLIIVEDLKRVNGPFDDKNKAPPINTKALFWVYKMIRGFYATCYFYWMPFIAISLPFIYLVIGEDLLEDI